MNHNDDRRESDIGELLQRFGDNWRRLAFIGPDRDDTIINGTILHNGASVKIHYFTT